MKARVTAKAAQERFERTTAKRTRSAAELLVATGALAVTAWAGVAPASSLWLGGGAMLVFGASGLHPQLDRDARILAWVGVAFAILLAIRVPAIWPLTQLLYLAPPTLALIALPALRPASDFFARGRLEGAPVVAMGGLATVVLVLWVELLSPDVTRYQTFLPDLPWPLLALGFVLFSVVNAVLEELVFRGLIQSALARLVGSPAVAIALQAILFGLCHWHGFPSGPVGAVLAGSWAVLLGWARHRTDGLLTPFLAHIVADATIFAIVVAHG